MITHLLSPLESFIRVTMEDAFRNKSTVAVCPCVKQERLETIEIIWLKLLNRESVRLHSEWLTPESLAHFFLSHDLCRSVFWVSWGLMLSQKTSAPHVSGSELSGEHYEHERSQPGPFCRASGEFQIMISLSYGRNVPKEWAPIGYILLFRL